MGYTHYWYTKKEIPADKWGEFINDCKELLDSDAAEGIVWSKKDKIFPYLTDEDCNFDGIGDNGHETFAMSRNRGRQESDGENFDCCKTAHKPYDKYVVDVLILAEKHFGDLIRVKSDGHWPDVKRDRELEKERECEKLFSTHISLSLPEVQFRCHEDDLEDYVHEFVKTELKSNLDWTYEEVSK